MANAATKKMVKEIVDYARTGANIYPFMFQPLHGRSNTVSAAIRIAKKDGLIVEGGKDGMGKPFYVANLPEPTHAISAIVQ